MQREETSRFERGTYHSFRTRGVLQVQRAAEEVESAESAETAEESTDSDAGLPRTQVTCESTRSVEARTEGTCILGMDDRCETARMGGAAAARFQVSGRLQESPGCDTCTLLLITQSEMGGNHTRSLIIWTHTQLLPSLTPRGNHGHIPMCCTPSAISLMHRHTRDSGVRQIGSNATVAWVKSDYRVQFPVHSEQTAICIGCACPVAYACVLECIG